MPIFICLLHMKLLRDAVQLHRYEMIGHFGSLLATESIPNVFNKEIWLSCAKQTHTLEHLVADECAGAHHFHTLKALCNEIALIWLLKVDVVFCYLYRYHMQLSDLPIYELLFSFMI